VLAAVDWSDWTEEEQLAALNRVLIVRDRDVVMNAEEMKEALEKPDRLQLPSRSQPKARQPQRQEFEVTATYNGIKVKRPDGMSLGLIADPEAVHKLHS
jgi:hypothetical protein